MIPVLFFGVNIYVLAATVFTQPDWVKIPGIIVLFLSIVSFLTSFVKLLQGAFK